MACRSAQRYDINCIRSQVDDVGLIDLVAAPVLFILLCFIGNGFRSLAKLTMRVSINKLKETDSRKPILYLRPFHEDRRSLPRPSNSPLFRMFSLGEGKVTLDALLLEDGVSYGPVFAIGDPRDHLSPYGPPRHYVEGQDWQTVVSDYLKQASVIFVFVDATPGMEWELKEIQRLGKVGICCFLTSPNADKAKARDMLQSTLNSFAVYTGSQAEEFVLKPDSIGFVFDNNGTPVEILSSGYDWVSYKIAIRAALKIRTEGFPLQSALANRFKALA